MTAGRLDVGLLGEVEVTLDGTRLAGFDSPRLQRLLAALTLSEKGQSRSRLAYTLWPDSTEAQAHANLRKVLHELRRALPGAERFFDIGSLTVRLRGEAECSVDVRSFRAALERGDLVDAARHYTGDLLPGCYDDWLVAERERLRSDALDVLVQLAVQAWESGRPEEAISHARRALLVDAVCERAFRLLMLAHAHRGDRTEALRTYHRCVEALDREIGVEPEDATRAAYEAIRKGDVPGVTVVPHPAPAASSRLVGREGEYRASLHAWRAASAGHVHLLLVTGEAGIGKTRVVDELGRAVGVEGGAVARTRSYQAAGRPPWGPVIDWLRSSALGPHLRTLDAIWLDDVARLLPEVRPVHPAPAPAAQVTEAARHHLLDSLCRGLLVAGRPLLLVIDDVQWCDADTLELLGFLVREHGDAPVLIAATARTDEVDDVHPLTALRLTLAREGILTEIALGRLDAAATAELAAELLGRSLDGPAAERIWRDTEGHPLFVVEAARTGLRTDGGSIRSPTVHAVIQSRLAQLSPPARRLCEVAATIGRSFTVEVLAAAGGTEAAGMVDALDELWRRQIVRDVGIGYDFTHDRIREVAYELIPPARRRHLHATVAGAIASTHRDAADVVSGALAVHYEQAGLLPEAVDAYCRAGRRSVQVFALEDAIAAFRRALLLLERLPAERRRDERELALRIALAVPLLATQGYGSDAVRDAYERALALCERLGRSGDPPVLRGLGLASLMTCRFDRATQLGEALLQQTAADATAAAEGHYLLGVSAFWRGEVESARHDLRAAIDAFRPDRADQHLVLYGQDPKAVCMIRLALAELWAGRPDASRALADDALRYASSVQHPTTQGYVRLYSAILAAERDEPGALAAHVVAGEAVWAGQQLGYFVRIGRLLRTWLEVLAGAAGRDAFDAAVSGWGRHIQTLHYSYALTLAARASLRGGDAGAGRAAAESGIHWSTTHHQRYLEPELRRLEGELLALAGERKAAEAALEHAIDLARSLGCRWYELKAACSLARNHPRPSSLAVLDRTLAVVDGGAGLSLVREARDLLGSGG